MTESATTEEGLSISTIGEVIGIFSLTGVGLGATGGVAVNLLGTGSGIVSGILVLVVLTVTFLLGPVIGLISGLRVGDEQGRSSESYLGGLLGSVAGYFAMILVVVLIISAVMAMGGGGGSETATTQTATGGSSSSGLPIGEYIVPIIAVAFPTGITGLGGVYFGGSAGVAQSSGIRVPKKYVASTIIILIIVAAGVTVVPGLLSSEPQFEIDGTTEIIQNTINADATVTNPTDGEKTETLTVDLVIDGSVVETRSQEITVPANDKTTIRWSLVYGSDLTQSQIDAVNQGNMKLRFVINDQVVDTDSPDAS